MASTLFWVSVAIILYHHLVYPALLHSFAEAKRRRTTIRVGSLAPLAAAEPPSLTVIVPAHNEAAVIASKIINLEELTYPRDRLRFVIALDGCTDETRRIAESAIAATPSFRNFELAEYVSNVGKVAVLNEQIAKASSEIVALSDASASVGHDAAAAAARHFADARVGVVCGTYSISGSGNNGERTYWRYQTQVKADEGALAAPLGAHGAFYLFRRRLWSPLPADTINDDFVLPMKIVLDGFRAVYDETIIAAELERAPMKQEFRRRVRIGAGNLQQVVRLAKLGHPRRGWLAFIFLSGKGLRATLPFFLIVAFCANVALALSGQVLYQGILAAQMALIALAAIGASRAKALLPKPLDAVCYLIHGHAASTVGALLLLAGQKQQAWNFSLAGKSNTRQITRGAGVPRR